MGGLFYPKFAYSSIKKNKKLYIPYILTSILWVTMFYIITSLSGSTYVNGLRGGTSLTMILSMGSPVILFFSLLFLFYTNSFLSKRRNKEYALYNIFGMNKRNIAHILLWDSIITFGISIVIGLLFGTVFYKFAELGLINIIKVDINYSLSVNWKIVLLTFISYASIFVLILLKTLFKINTSNPIELLTSENTGEKPPKANWFVGILGLIILGIAYFIAFTVKNPFSALYIFFIAVILVIIGTYLLFVSGSVVLCRILQKNKSYYYKANHFISVSSMMYRMKRNGSGLASICILATMVLVMISSTTCLYFGTEDSIVKRYPREMNIQFETENIGIVSEDFINNIDAFIDDECSKLGIIPENKEYYKTVVSLGQLENGILKLDSENFSQSFNMYQIYIVSLEDYNKIMGKSEILKENEVFIYATLNKFTEETLTINGGNTYNVIKHLDEFWSNSSSAMTVIPSLFMVVSDLEYVTKDIDSVTKTGFIYGFDSNLNNEKQIELYDKFPYISEKLLNVNDNIISANFESRESNRADFYGLYGGLFFIGILLSILFISAAVLIIYYKQIVEGYEDKNRFGIMQKVGMTKKEIRKSINSQLLTVFFMPLIAAGIHLFFAFPIIQKLLLMFNLTNISLFTLTTIVSFLVFGLFYAFVYQITSNSYYSIVSKQEVDT